MQICGEVFCNFASGWMKSFIPKAAFYGAGCGAWGGVCNKQRIRVWGKVTG